LDPTSPFSVGNGEFAFTADVTGLQTFPEEYQEKMPLCTMAQWGWHSSALPEGLDPKLFQLTRYPTYGRQVGYPTSSEGQLDLYTWLRANPHRLHLGRIGLLMTNRSGDRVRSREVTEVDQLLDLWTGVLISKFKVADMLVTVRTTVHPASDLVAVSIESALLTVGRLRVVFAFPFGSPATTKVTDWQQVIAAADWNLPQRHESRVTHQLHNRAEIERILDSDRYFVTVGWSSQAQFKSERAHEYVLIPSRGHTRLEFVTRFSPRQTRESLPLASNSLVMSAKHWESFWNRGAAIDFTECSDRRAPELERRIVLSQYLTAIQCSGSVPPQETGLTLNSWYGKSHLEMHWWHAAHFALWNRIHLLERSLGWYVSILPRAREWAKFQGYDGARWPKMVGRDGRDSPSPIGPLLIWQQPHPIFYSELCYLSRPRRETLERYRPIVFESADFMASFAVRDSTTNRFVLGPPLIPAQENHPPRETWNPTFELAYWDFGLSLAQTWRLRLGMKRNNKWDEVLNALSPLPIREGVYLSHSNCPQTYTERNHDHPSMLGALGILPGDKVDRESMRRTLQKVMKEWQWDRTWGWDYPMTAMTAARLNEPELAIDALMMETEKNRYAINGHNWQRPGLPCYLPGNGGLLYAIGLMAGGWRGSPGITAPGFPRNGSWNVKQEGFNNAILKAV
jgi:hypothetical protein